MLLNRACFCLSAWQFSDGRLEHMKKAKNKSAALTAREKVPENGIE